METPFKIFLLTIIISLILTISAIDESVSSLPSHAADLSLSASDFVAPVLTHLGFHSLATVPVTSSGPLTVFATSDASIQNCASCSVPRILQEHIVPGIFSLQQLQSLASGTKIETIVPGRCVTVTSASDGTKIFVEGVEITHPDIFNNGLLVVHGMLGYVTHLSPFSCNVEFSVKNALDDASSFSGPKKSPAGTGLPKFNEEQKLVVKNGGGISGWDRTSDLSSWSKYITFNLAKWLVGFLALCVVVLVVSKEVGNYGHCDYCEEETFSSDAKFREHFKTFHSFYKIPCPTCKVHVFNTPDECIAQSEKTRLCNPGSSIVPVHPSPHSSLFLHLQRSSSPQFRYSPKLQLQVQ